MVELVLILVVGVFALILWQSFRNRRQGASGDADGGGFVASSSIDTAASNDSSGGGGDGGGGGGDG